MAGERGKRRKRRPRKRDHPAQSRKFIEEARKLGVDESGEAFSKALDKLVPKKEKDGNN
jgi:hypothetical protein